MWLFPCKLAIFEEAAKGAMIAVVDPLRPCSAEAARGKGRGRLGRVARDTSSGRESDVAGKKRPKSLAQTGKKEPAKPKRPKKTSRGK